MQKTNQRREREVGCDEAEVSNEENELGQTLYPTFQIEKCINSVLFIAQEHMRISLLVHVQLQFQHRLYHLSSSLSLLVRRHEAALTMSQHIAERHIRLVFSQRCRGRGTRQWLQGFSGRVCARGAAAELAWDCAPCQMHLASSSVCSTYCSYYRKCQTYS